MNNPNWWNNIKPFDPIQNSLFTKVTVEEVRKLKEMFSKERAAEKARRQAVQAEFNDILAKQPKPPEPEKSEIEKAIDQWNEHFKDKKDDLGR